MAAHQATRCGAVHAAASAECRLQFSSVLRLGHWRALHRACAAQSLGSGTDWPAALMMMHLIHAPWSMLDAASGSTHRLHLHVLVQMYAAHVLFNPPASWPAVASAEHLHARVVVC